MEQQTTKPIQFEDANLRQTAQHVIKYRGCKSAFNEYQLIEHMKAEATKAAATAVINDDLTPLYSVEGVTAWFTINEYIVDSKLTDVVNFFIRIGRRQEYTD